MTRSVRSLERAAHRAWQAGTTEPVDSDLALTPDGSVV